MPKKTIQTTLQEFLNAWEQKDIEEVIDLLADSFEYFESPLEKPLTTKEEVRELWKPVPKFEAKISLSFATLSLEKEFGIFRIEGSYKHTYDKSKKTTKIDRIFLLAVNKKGNITKFIQWREYKDINKL